MKQEDLTYKYIHFYLLESKGKTKVYECRNNRSNSCLGLVKWYGPWRQYCFFPMGETVFNNGCLTDIQEFIKKLMNERKKKTCIG